MEKMKKKRRRKQFSKFQPLGGWESGDPKWEFRKGLKLPCRAVPWRAVACRGVPCRAVPCRAVPCRAVPCRAVPCRAMPSISSLAHNSGLH